MVVLGGLELDGNAAGIGYLLAASTCWAAYIVVGSRVAQQRPGRDPGSASVWRSAPSPSSRSARPAAVSCGRSPRLLAACLLVGVFSNAIGYGIDQHVLRRIPVRRFSVLLALLPVTAVVLGWLVLDQQPSALDLGGIALVLAGVVLQEREELAAELALPEPS